VALLTGRPEDEAPFLHLDPKIDKDKERSQLNLHSVSNFSNENVSKQWPSYPHRHDLTFT